MRAVENRSGAEQRKAEQGSAEQSRVEQSIKSKPNAAYIQQFDISDQNNLRTNKYIRKGDFKSDECLRDTHRNRVGGLNLSAPLFAHMDTQEAC